jgi:hypothetical protein
MYAHSHKYARAPARKYAHIGLYMSVNLGITWHIRAIFITSLYQVAGISYQVYSKEITSVHGVAVSLINQQPVSSSKIFLSSIQPKIHYSAHKSHIVR